MLLFYKFKVCLDTRQQTSGGNSEISLMKGKHENRLIAAFQIHFWYHRKSKLINK